MRIPRIFCEQSLQENNSVELDEKASHHLIKVLRMQIGRELLLFNGDGCEYPATISGLTKKNATVATGKKNDANRESPLTTHLAIALSKGDRFDWVLQKATELGATEITPLFSERSEVKLSGERLTKRLASWRQIIISACEQCQRNVLPTLNAPMNIMHFIETSHEGLKLVLHHRNTQKLSAHQQSSQVTLLIGPEGGLSEDEINLAIKNQYAALALGPRVLRTETAPLAALSCLQMTWGDI